MPILLALLAAMAVESRPAIADTLIATRTVRSQSILGAEDLSVTSDTVPGALQHPLDAIGLEARVVLYAGRPIRAEDVGPPALIERNGLVKLLYRQGGLSISADGRSLSRAAEGERVRALNLASRATVTGTVDRQGRIIVESAASDR